MIYGEGIQREMVDFFQYVLLYGMKTLFGIESMNALPELLFSDEAAMRAGAFLLRGEADRGRGLGHGLPDGRPQDEGDPGEEGEAGQLLGGAARGPFQVHAEAAALGLAALLLKAHPSVIQGHDVSEGVWQICRQPPGFLLPHGPDPHDPNPDGPILAENDPAQVHRLPWGQMSGAQETATGGPGGDQEIGSKADDKRLL